MIRMYLLYMLMMNREEMVISAFLLKHLEVLTYESSSVMGSIVTQKQVGHGRQVAQPQL